MKGCGHRSPEAGRGRKDRPWEPPEGARPCLTLTPALWTDLRPLAHRLREQKFLLFLSHQVQDSLLLTPPQGTNPDSRQAQAAWLQGQQEPPKEQQREKGGDLPQHFTFTPRLLPLPLCQAMCPDTSRWRRRACHFAPGGPGPRAQDAAFRHMASDSPGPGAG